MVIGRSLALSTPTVTVWSNPYGLPIATTQSPILILSELPIGSVGKIRAFDFQDRKVQVIVGAELLRHVRLAVALHGDLDFVCVSHDVLIREDIAAGIEEESGTDAFRRQFSAALAALAASLILPCPGCRFYRRRTG